ncbi:MAG: MFS transporter [Candidatus Beckwithbacteria bacterium]|nr:MFS transporter [Patescibacteria group bacterium]
MKLDRRLLIILLIQITEVLGFSLILPFLPFYAQEMGATPLTISLIIGSFSLLQFLSSPIMGRLSDVYGRRPLLIASQISTFLSFVVLAQARSVGMLFVSRAIDGALGSNFIIAQAYISDISSKEDRSKAFGISGAAFGIGFLIGPALGGYLSKFGFAVPAYLAAGLSLLTIILTVLFLPETVERGKIKMGKIKIVEIQVFKKYLSLENTRRGLMIFLTFNLVMMVWQGNFAMYSGKKWGFTARDVGFTLAYIGLVNVILRGVLLSKLIDKWGERALKRFGLVAIIVGLLCLGLVTSGWMVAGVMSIYALGSGMARPLLMGDISRSVSEEEQGAVLGVAGGLGSLTQIVGPVFGGWLLTNFIPESLMVVSMLIMMVGFSLLVIKKNVVE